MKRTYIDIGKTAGDALEPNGKLGDGAVIEPCSWAGPDHYLVRTA
jgi:hypothetical protein